MRFGWLAAAAAMVCASQVEAARYYEFEVTGDAIFLDGLGRQTRYTDVTTFSYDTILPPSGGYYAASGLSLSIVFNPANGFVESVQGAGGPRFGLAFTTSSIPNSSTLQTVAASGRYNIELCDRSYCFGAPLSYLTSFKARTFDVAPSALGVTSSVTTSTAVPEPASWAMMIVGVGMIGAAARRRKVQAAQPA